MWTLVWCPASHPDDSKKTHPVGAMWTRLHDSVIQPSRDDTTASSFNQKISQPNFLHFKKRQLVQLKELFLPVDLSG